MPLHTNLLTTSHIYLHAFMQTSSESSESTAEDEDGERQRTKAPSQRRERQTRRQATAADIAGA